MISLLILLAAVASLLTFVRRLPAQNLVAIAALILLASGGVEVLAWKTNFPFRTFQKYEVVFLFGIVPWPAPALWMVFLLNARSLAQFLLRSRRQSTSYGFWLLGSLSFLTAAFWAVVEDSSPASESRFSFFHGRWINGGDQ